MTGCMSINLFHENYFMKFEENRIVQNRIVQNVQNFELSGKKMDNHF